MKTQKTYSKAKSDKRSKGNVERIRVRKVVPRKPKSTHRFVHARIFGVPTKDWTLSDFFNVFSTDFRCPSFRQVYASLSVDGRVIVSGNVTAADGPKFRKLRVPAIWDAESQCWYLDTEANPQLADAVLRKLGRVFANLHFVLRANPKYPKK